MNFSSRSARPESAPCERQRLQNLRNANSWSYNSKPYYNISKQPGLALKDNSEFKHRELFGEMDLGCGWDFCERLGRPPNTRRIFMGRRGQILPGDEFSTNGLSHPYEGRRKCRYDSYESLEQEKHGEEYMSRSWMIIWKLFLAPGFSARR